MWIGFASLIVSGFLISHPKTFIHFLRLMSSEKFVGLHLLPKDLHPPATSLQGIDYACNRMIMRFSIAFDHRWGEQGSIKYASARAALTGSFQERKEATKGERKPGKKERRMERREEGESEGKRDRIRKKIRGK